jgi:hypothetical protein
MTDRCSYGWLGGSPSLFFESAEPLLENTCRLVACAPLTGEVIQPAAIAQRNRKSCNWKEQKKDTQQPDQRHHAAI